jgi:hypothetical protein
MGVQLEICNGFLSDTNRVCVIQEPVIQRQANFTAGWSRNVMDDQYILTDEADNGDDSWQQVEGDGEEFRASLLSQSGSFSLSYVPSTSLSAGQRAKCSGGKLVQEAYWKVYNDFYSIH